MIDLRFRPLERWPEKTALGKARSPFKTKWQPTLDILEYELKKLSAKNILIEAGFTLAQLRNDGWPHGTAYPKHQGVILYFEGADGHLRFPCGNYSDWHANVHAIGLTLVNLRAIDRYGVTLGHQQYAGFKGIAPPPGMSIEDAARFIGEAAHQDPHLIFLSPQIFKQAYRAAAGKLHPDKEQGSKEMFIKLGEAKSAMETHHGIAGGAAA